MDRSISEMDRSISEMAPPSSRWQKPSWETCIRRWPDPSRDGGIFEMPRHPRDGLSHPRMCRRVPRRVNLVQPERAGAQASHNLFFVSHCNTTLVASGVVEYDRKTQNEKRTFRSSSRGSFETFTHALLVERGNTRVRQSWFHDGIQILLSSSSAISSPQRDPVRSWPLARVFCTLDTALEAGEGRIRAECRLALLLTNSAVRRRKR